MCGKKFELKIDNVRFVGHPTLLQHALGQVGMRSPLGTCLPHKMPGFREETCNSEWPCWLLILLLLPDAPSSLLLTSGSVG